MCTFHCHKRQLTKHRWDHNKSVLLHWHRCIISVKEDIMPFFSLDVLLRVPQPVVLRWGLRERRPLTAKRLAAAAAWQDSKRTLWGLKVPKASWVISHYGAVTEGSAVNTEIIWAMVNDSAVQAFGMIKDRSSCTRHLSGPWITPPASSWVSGAERIAGEACADTQINMFPLSPLTTPGNGY